MEKSPSTFELSELHITTEALSKDKENMLETCVSDPRFYIKCTDYIVLSDHTIYKVEIGILNKNTKQMHIRQISTRYSILYEFYINAMKYVSNTMDKNKILSFPPKKWLWYNNKEVAEQRMKEFNHFFLDIIRIPGISTIQPFIDVFGLVQLT